jgi:23S rRNA (cytosine1962-C5)-methyltransferase
MFCYTGGFSVYALGGGADMVHSVDSSSQVVAAAEKNVIINTGNDGRHSAIHANAFGFLNNIVDYM